MTTAVRRPGRAVHHRRALVPLRLMVGTGGSTATTDTMARAIEASGAEIVTVGPARGLDRTKEEGVLYHLDAKRYFLPRQHRRGAHRRGCRPYARLAREPFTSSSSSR